MNTVSKQLVALRSSASDNFRDGHEPCDIKYKKLRPCLHGAELFYCAPSGRMFQRVKVSNLPDSGKDIAKSKGGSGNWESEGSWRQITGLTNRNHEG